jgi:nitrate/nitrite transporter NarK
LAVVLLLRLASGVAQAGAYPTSGGLLSSWVPLTQRAFASSAVALGGRVGGVAASVLTAYLIVAFVPLGISSLLREDDLLDPAGLVEQLRQTADTPAGRLAARVRALWPSAGPPAEDNLLAGLNAVLQRPDLFQPSDARDWSLEREAVRLAEVPEGERTPAQVERLNRLLLEAAYPRFVRKLYGVGWRPVVLLYGLAGVVVAALFWVGFRDRPREHPGCNAGEVALIEAGRPAAAAVREPLPDFPWRGVLTNASFLLNCVAQFTTNFGWVFLLTWLPRYLTDVHHVPVGERGWMAGMPILVGIAGMAMGGWLCDRLTLALGLRWGRCAVLVFSRFVAMAAYLACLALPTPWEVVAALSVVAWATDLGTPSMWAYAQDVGGRYVGAVLGWGNMCGNFGAAFSPLVLNWLVEERGWDALFLACAGAFFVSGVASLGVDATSRLTSPSHSGAGEKESPSSADSSM